MVEKKKGRGRPKGALNKTNQQLRAELEKQGLDPNEPVTALVSIGRAAMAGACEGCGRPYDPQLAVKAYAEAAPYLMPRLGSIQVEKVGVDEAAALLAGRWLTVALEFIPESKRDAFRAKLEEIKAEGEKR